MNNKMEGSKKYGKPGDLKSSIKVKIKRDLSFKRVKKIVNKGNTRHVFTLNSKEFIFVKTRGTWILKTIIKRNRQQNSYAIQKRLRETA